MKKGLFQLQYEPAGAPRYTEAGSDRGAKLAMNEVSDQEVRQLLVETAELGYKDLLKYLKDKQNKENGKTVIIPITTRTPEALAYRLEGQQPKLVFMQRPLHTINLLNEQ